MKKVFNLNYQYQLYLERCGLKENQLSFVQNQEMKRAFFGACGQILLVLRDDVSEFDEDKAVEIFSNMLNQVSDFFIKELNKEN